jgi:hypothetical protein
LYNDYIIEVENKNPHWGLRNEGEHMNQYDIGESAYLKVPFRGYSYVEIVGFEGDRLVVQITSGYEFTVNADELED